MWLSRSINTIEIVSHVIIGFFLILTLSEAIAEIAGAPDVHIDEGSTLRLECKIMQVTENPSYVFW